MTPVHLDGPWWHGFQRYGERPAFIRADGTSLSYRELEERVVIAAARFHEHPRGLGFLFVENDVPSLVMLLACLRAGQVPLVLPRTLPAESRARLQAAYHPDWMAEACHGRDDMLSDLWWLETPGDDRGAPAPELGLLLSTSGTTASPKLVRLSYRGLQANARSILEYLDITERDRALTVLPPSYSYGLSVISSHLLAGASLVVTEVSVLTRQFVTLVDERQVTSISGVPYTYHMLHRSGFGRHGLASLQVMTQAGGRLDDALVRHFAGLAAERGWRFYVMYGQTEATARISYVPANRIREKIGSIGVPIPGGSLSLDAATNEIIYRGPNVALGYAQTRSDLSRSDDFGGLLRTGDLGRCDDEGFFFITGRISRFIKLAGNRIGLDEVEQRLQSVLGCPVVVGGRDDLLVALIESTAPDAAQIARQVIATEYRIHHSLCRLHTIAALPLLGNGKKDYSQLPSLA